MLKREHIEYEIRKVKKDIYDIEQKIFTCFTDLQDRLDALNKYVRSTYGLEDLKPFFNQIDYNQIDLEEYLQKKEKDDEKNS